MVQIMVCMPKLLQGHLVPRLLNIYLSMLPWIIVNYFWESYTSLRMLLYLTKSQTFLEFWRIMRLVKPMAPTILERGLPICGLRPNHVCAWSKSMTFPTPHIDHSRHGLFFTRWNVNPMLNLLKRTMTYPGFESRTFGLAVSITNHYTI
jgi:hypothetical protein